MKTVMKKMFSLLLVAVMLVGVMPFQAFAAPGDFYPGGGFPGGGFPGGTEHAHYYVDGGWETTTNPTCTNEGSKTRTCASPNCNDREGSRQTESIPALTHSFPETWTVSQAPTCDNVGEEVRICTRCNGNETGGRETRAIDALGHTEVIDAAVAPSCDETGLTQGSHCSACPAIITAQTEVAALGHDFENGACSVCGEEEPEEKEPVEEEPAAPVRQDITWQIKNKEGGAVVDSGSFTPNGETAKAKDILYYHVFNKTTAWKDQYSVDKVWSSKQQKDVGYEGSIDEGDTVTYVLTPKENNSGNSGSSNSGSNNSGSNVICSKCNGAHDAADCPNNGGYNLKIYATMWTGDGREETVYLGTFYNLTPNTKIATYMTENSNSIHNWVANQCPGYRWSDGNIFEDKKSTDLMEHNDSMGYSDKEAYINVKRSSKDVILFLHTGRVYEDYDWIKVEGKTTNDTLTLDEAKAIVKKYYNFSSLKMYSNDDWNEYVAGNNNIAAQNAVAIGSGNVTKIHILMSGYSAKTSSGTSSSAKADSSNPKTGDAIYAPVMVLGASASALAVLFYLNKKRAF